MMKAIFILPVIFMSFSTFGQELFVLEDEKTPEHVSVEIMDRVFLKIKDTNYASFPDFGINLIDTINGGVIQGVKMGADFKIPTSDSVFLEPNEKEEILFFKKIKIDTATGFYGKKLIKKGTPERDSSVFLWKLMFHDEGKVWYMVAVFPVNSDSNSISPDKILESIHISNSIQDPFENLSYTFDYKKFGFEKPSFSGLKFVTFSKSTTSEKYNPKFSFTIASEGSEMIESMESIFMLKKIYDDKRHLIKNDSTSFIFDTDEASIYISNRDDHGRGYSVLDSQGLIFYKDGLILFIHGQGVYDKKNIEDFKNMVLAIERKD